MAYTALVSLVQTIDLILDPHRYSVSVDAKHKIMCIHDHVIFVLSFLEYYPEKANLFEGLITDVANEAEDILENFMWNQKSMSVEVDNKLVIEFEHQLEVATGKTSSIAEELMDIKRSLGIEDERHMGHSRSAVLSSRIASAGENDIVIGLDDVLTTMKGRLCGESSKLQVIPIKGMGGIGKTTLARNAYDEALIIEYFDIRVWVTLSQYYSFDKILSRLVDSLKLSEMSEMKLSEMKLSEKKKSEMELSKMKLTEIKLSEMKLSEEKKKSEEKKRLEEKKKLEEKKTSLMAEKVYKCLKGRRYLIVLDDVWSTKAWDDLRVLFPDDNNGSRIMLTTRLSDVAAYPISEGSPVHEMKFMDENQSWNLLRQKVFTNGQECPPELEDIGKAIAGGCSGLPLAIVLVAGILPMIDKTRASWEEIAKNVISVVDGQLEKILSLSYMHLPHYLRPCFLYIGGFPEDYEIHASRLIKLWVAEGFLRRESERKSLEEEAEEYLEDLVKRSLVLVTRREVTGEIKSCNLHDLVRDACIRKAHEEKFIYDVMNRYNLQRSIKNRRRIGSVSHLHFNGPNIRTFLCLRLMDRSRLPAFVSRRFRLLRVLDVVSSYAGLLPSQLFELIHLRYLALGSPDEIPAAISNLHNLQTLIINSKTWGSHKVFPQGIWRMQQLRHLVLPRGCRLPKPVDGSTLPLENLQTLTGVTDLHQDILKMIPNLKKLEMVDVIIEDGQVQNLVHLHQLVKLKFSYRLDLRRQIPAFPKTLRKLSLEGGYLPWKDMSVIGSLPNLEVLKLKGLAFHDPSSQTWETADGEFPQLRFLLIQAPCFEHWITESSHFPRLKCLVLRRCYSLPAIPDGVGEIPALELIQVDGGCQSLADSAKQIQEEQRDYGNDTLQVRCIPVRSMYVDLLW